MTEEIWQAIPKKEGAPESIMIAPWPKENAAFYNREQADKTQTLIAIVSAIRNIRGEANIAPSKAIPQMLALCADPEKRKIVSDMTSAIRQLAKVDAITVADSSAQKPAPCAIGVADGVELVVPFADLIDIDEERARLDKNIAKVQKDLDASERKLGNPNFVSRAKPEVVAVERERIEKSRLELEKLQKARAMLS